MKPKCPLCRRRGCKKKLCANIIGYHGVFTRQGLKVTESGKKLYEKLKWQKKN